ncbi:MAG: hypothetical protein JSR44_12755 [Spirochaetes bacterium]|nr:hypothetical protein [Spirochaetota bacterium]
MMEILLLVIAVFSENTLVKIEIRNYSGYASSKDPACEAYIGSAHFYKTLHIGKIKNARVKAKCVSPSQLYGLGNMVTEIQGWNNVGESTHTNSAKPFPAQTVTLSGVIVYRPIVDRRKSVDAYLGKSLTLETASGIHVLFASDAVSESDLQKLNGKKVELRAVFEDHTPAADSIEQYPTDSYGKPLRRSGYRVLGVLK